MEIFIVIVRFARYYDTRRVKCMWVCAQCLWMLSISKYALFHSFLYREKAQIYFNCIFRYFSIHWCEYILYARIFVNVSFSIIISVVFSEWYFVFLLKLLSKYPPHNSPFLCRIQIVVLLIFSLFGWFNVWLNLLSTRLTLHNGYGNCIGFYYHSFAYTHIIRSWRRLYVISIFIFSIPSLPSSRFICSKFHSLSRFYCQAIFVVLFFRCWFFCFFWFASFISVRTPWYTRIHAQAKTPISILFNNNLLRTKWELSPIFWL